MRNHSTGRMIVGVLAVLLTLLGPAAGAGAQEIPSAPEGEAVFVPLVDTITIDGLIDDWDGLPQIIVTDGPFPSPNPAENGSISWSVATDGANILIALTMPDATIVAGGHGEQYWNEDSIEFYLNFSGALDATDYQPLIGQMRFSPLDIGNTDARDLFVTGIDATEFDVDGFVFATDDGWGVEAQIAIPAGFDTSHGSAFGIQMQANGSSGGDRDVKLIWSTADTSDTSFQDPSVFGVGVFFDPAAGTVPPLPGEDGAEPVPDEEPPAEDEVEPTTTTAPAPQADSGETDADAEEVETDPPADADEDIEADADGAAGTDSEAGDDEVGAGDRDELATASESRLPLYIGLLFGAVGLTLLGFAAMTLRTPSDDPDPTT